MTIYKSKNFQVEIMQLKNEVHLLQHVYHDAWYTEELPKTVSLLQKHIPTIFSNECFNDREVPFLEEVRSTEIAHLLEHIIIEKLKLYYMNKNGEADFWGETSWDWDKTEAGVFRISISSRKQENLVFKKILDEAMQLLETIYNEHEVGAKRTERGN